MEPSGPRRYVTARGRPTATQIKHILGSAAHAARAFELSAGDDPAIALDHIAESRIFATPVVVEGPEAVPKRTAWLWTCQGADSNPGRITAPAGDRPSCG
jgi:hypothetical protein